MRRAAQDLARLCGLPTPSSHSAQHGPSGRSRSQLDKRERRLAHDVGDHASWCAAGEQCRSASATTR